MEKSKFFKMKTKNKIGEAEVSETEASFTEVEVNDLLATIEESAAEIKKAVEVLPEVLVEKAVEPDTVKMITRKAYNIRQDPMTKLYMLDTIEYGGEGDNTVFSLTTRKLSSSQPMAMYEIKKIFTNKLILKKAGF